MARRLFVTTALPYANGPFHIGHIMEYIQADIWVRFQRIQGHEVHFMGADDAHGADVSSLRGTASTSFGTILTRALADRWHRFTGAQVFEAGYGLSETHSSDVMMPADAVRWGTNGRPVPGTEVRIVDPDTGQPRPCGAVGEILLRGPLPFRGYWMRPEATAAMLRDGWVRTGDLGVMDERGYCRVTGRLKDMIIRGGENIYPAQVEGVLMKHPVVADAAVFGMADAHWGERVAAAVRFKPGADVCTAEDLRQFCRQHIAPHKTPEHWFICEAFPLTGSGKVQ